MNIKKLVVTAAAAGVLLASAVPAFAHHSSDWDRRGGDVEIKVENEDTTVKNNVLTASNTGLNRIEGGRRGSRSIDTGNALAASEVHNTVNTSTVDLCGCLSDRRGGDVKVEVENEDTNVTNNVLTVSNTGLNKIEGGRKGSRSIDTGNAGSDGYVTNVVNTNVVN